RVEGLQHVRRYGCVPLGSARLRIQRRRSAPLDAAGTACSGGRESRESPPLRGGGTVVRFFGRVRRRRGQSAAVPRERIANAVSRRLTFRRTYSSWSHDKGVPGKVVAQLMGHANVDTTLNIYT